MNNGYTIIRSISPKPNMVVAVPKRTIAVKVTIPRIAEKYLNGDFVIL